MCDRVLAWVIRAGIKRSSTIYKSDQVTVKYFGFYEVKQWEGADEGGASVSLCSPDVPGCSYNIFNSVMTDAANRAPLACLRILPGTVRSFSLTQNPHQKYNPHVIAIIFNSLAWNYLHEHVPSKARGTKGSRWRLDVPGRHFLVMLRWQWRGYWFCGL